MHKSNPGRGRGTSYIDMLEDMLHFYRFEGGPARVLGVIVKGDVLAFPIEINEPRVRKSTLHLNLFRIEEEGRREEVGH